MAVATHTVVRLGSRGPDVVELQKLLNTKLWPSPNLRADGWFGVRTEQAVQQFQRQHRLMPDGVVGSKTWHAFDSEGESLIKEHLRLAGIPADKFAEHLRGWDLKQHVKEVFLWEDETIFQYITNAMFDRPISTGNYFGLRGAQMTQLGIGSGLAGRHAVEFKVLRTVKVLEGIAGEIITFPGGHINGIGGATQIFIWDKGLSSLTAVGPAH